MKIPKMKIGDVTLKIPIIQGGMGIGVSCSGLATAVASAGGVGVISGAQIGYKENNFDTNPVKANVNALKKEIKKAKDNSLGGIIGVNLMVAMKNYADMVKASVEEKVDIIISGAGLPINLPSIVNNTKVKLIPIVSSMKAARIIINIWEKKHNRTPDAIIVEGPKAGGHLGFKMDELINNETKDLETIVKEVINYVKSLNKNIPVIAAGGIYDGYDIAKFLKLGASGVQMATRFVPTEECDAHINFKNAYINSSIDDIIITKSPVGLPGRAISNNFIKNLDDQKNNYILRCYNCLEKCNPKETPYCITKALINSVEGNTEDGLLFVGSNAYKCNKIETVQEVIDTLMKELELA